MTCKLHGEYKESYFSSQCPKCNFLEMTGDLVPKGLYQHKKPTKVSDPSQKWKILLMIIALFVGVEIIKLLKEILTTLQKHM